jgi:hypothetical protein
MHLLRQLEIRISKKECLSIANKLLNNDRELHVFIDFIKSKNAQVVNNVFWILREIQITRKDFIILKAELIFGAMMFNKNHSGIFRNGLALFKKTPIPSTIETQFYNICFALIQNSSSAIALKAFSMDVCFNIAKKHPELLKELSCIIEDLINTHGQKSGAISSSGKRVLEAIGLRLRK